MATETPIERLERIFALQASAHLADPDPTAQVRIDRIRRIGDLLRRHRFDCFVALSTANGTSMAFPYP